MLVHLDKIFVMNDKKLSTRFNLRVYGLLINKHNQLLLSDELIRGEKVTKLPGGGLLFGEGTHDCLRREFLEEMNLPIDIVRHYYTTDFFQLSKFDQSHQVISIYYLIRPAAQISINVSNEKYDFGGSPDPTISLRWEEIKKVSEATFTFPIDKHVGKLIRKKGF